MNKFFFSQTINKRKKTTQKIDEECNGGRKREAYSRSEEDR